MNPNDHSATRKIHKTRATIYSLQCPTEANEKFQSSLIHKQIDHGWSSTNRHALLTLRLTQQYTLFQRHNSLGRYACHNRKTDLINNSIDQVQ